MIDVNNLTDEQLIALDEQIQSQELDTLPDDELLSMYKTLTADNNPDMSSGIQQPEGISPFPAPTPQPSLYLQPSNYPLDAPGRTVLGAPPKMGNMPQPPSPVSSSPFLGRMGMKTEASGNPIAEAALKAAEQGLPLEAAMRLARPDTARLKQVDLQNRQQSQQFDMNNWDAAPYADRIRRDGTVKGSGYYGALPLNTGGIATELSITANLNGEDRDIPALVPTLSPEEIAHLTSGNPVTPEIAKKAMDHAQARIALGLSPYAREGDKIPPTIADSTLNRLQRQFSNIKEVVPKKEEIVPQADYSQLIDMGVDPNKLQNAVMQQQNEDYVLSGRPYGQKYIQDVIRGQDKPEVISQGIVPKQVNELIRPFAAQGAATAREFNKAMSGFSSRLDTVGDSMGDAIENVTGKRPSKGGLFDMAAKEYAANADYWDKRAKEYGENVIDEIIGTAVGGAFPGITEFSMNVPWAITYGAAEAQKKGEHPLIGALKEGSKRLILEGLFSSLHGYNRPITAAGMGGVMATQTLAEGGTFPEAGKAGVIGALYGASGGGGRGLEKADYSGFRGWWEKLTENEKNLASRMARDGASEGEILKAMRNKYGTDSSEYQRLKEEALVRRKEGFAPSTEIKPLNRGLAITGELLPQEATYADTLRTDQGKSTEAKPEDAAIRSEDNIGQDIQLQPEEGRTTNIGEQLRPEEVVPSIGASVSFTRGKTTGTGTIKSIDSAGRFTIETPEGKTVKLVLPKNVTPLAGTQEVSLSTPEATPQQTETPAATLEGLTTIETEVKKNRPTGYYGTFWDIGYKDGLAGRNNADEMGGYNSAKASWYRDGRNSALKVLEQSKLEGVDDLKRLRKIPLSEGKNPDELSDDEFLRDTIGELYDDVFFAEKGGKVFYADGTVGGNKSGVPAWAQNIVLDRTEKRTGKAYTSEASRDEVTAALKTYLDTNRLLSANQKKIVESVIYEARKRLEDRPSPEEWRRQQGAELQSVPIEAIQPGDKFKIKGEEFTAHEDDGQLILKDGETIRVGEAADTIAVDNGLQGIEKGEVSAEKQKEIKDINNTAVLDSKHTLKNPIKGKTGSEIIGYQWVSKLEDGMYGDRRVSDWADAQTSEPTGRKIVHLFWVKGKDGQVQIMGVNAAKNALGTNTQRLYSIAKAEQANQKRLKEFWDEEAVKIEKTAAESSAEAAQRWRNVNNPSRAMWGTEEERTKRYDEAFKNTTLLQKNGKYIRTGDTDTVTNLIERGWSDATTPEPPSDAISLQQETQAQYEARIAKEQRGKGDTLPTQKPVDEMPNGLFNPLYNEGTKPRQQTNLFGQINRAKKDIVGEEKAGGVSQKDNISEIRNLYHGSPHSFDRFDSSKIGTGEGAQAFGYGHYLTEAEAIGRGYAERLARDTLTYDGKEYRPEELISKLSKEATDNKALEGVKFVTPGSVIDHAVYGFRNGESFNLIIGNARTNFGEKAAKLTEHVLSGLENTSFPSREAWTIAPENGIRDYRKMTKEEQMALLDVQGRASWYALSKDPIALVKEELQNTVKAQTQNIESFENKALKNTSGYVADIANARNRLKDAETALSLFDKYNLIAKVEKPRRNLYTVTLHEGKTPDQYDYLMWSDKVTYAQEKKVKDEWDKLNSRQPEGSIWKRPLVENLDANAGWVPRKGNTVKGFEPEPILNWDGKVLYEHLSRRLGSDREASAFLLRAGIDGIKYPAGSLSGATSGAYNYVVFDDKAISIKEKQLYENKDKYPVDNINQSTDNIDTDTINKQIAEEVKDEIRRTTGVGEEGEREGVGISGRRLGGAIRDTLDAFQRGEICAFKGKTVTGPQDIAVIGQLHRNQKVEHLRLIAVDKNGIVINTIHVSANLPGQVYFDRLKIFPEIRNLINRGAVKIYMLHNHPSGDPKPSKDHDFQVTQMLHDTFPGYIGEHIIIDSGNYATIDKNGISEIHNLELPENWEDELLKPDLPHHMNGTKIDNYDKVAMLGRAINISPDMGVVFFVNSKMNIRGIEEVPISHLDNPVADINKYIKNQGLRYGAGSAMLYIPGKTRTINPDLIKKNTYKDIIFDEFPGEQGAVQSEFEREQLKDLRVDLDRKQHGFFAGEPVENYEGKVTVFEGDKGYGKKDADYLAAVERGDMETAQKMVDEKLEDVDAYWHGTPSGDLRGGTSGLHVGTKLAATQALEARIGIPADGNGWDGSKEYGKTLLAGKKSIRSGKFGKYRESGYNVDVPENDFYPTEKKEPTVGNGVPVDFTWKPYVRPVLIIGKMTNTNTSPMSDIRANATMRGMIKKGFGVAKRGYYYTNDGEDSGSVSAVLPNGDAVRVKLPDPVTYDNQGNVIPLSQRFNPKKDSILYEEQSGYGKDPRDNPAFVRWFKDSKVVDENGRPLVVYHGTADDFQSFKMKGLGSWFTVDKDNAEHYSQISARYRDNATERIMPVYLSIKNPATMGLVDKYKEEGRKLKVNKSTTEYAREKLMALGYDGIAIDDNTAFIAFSPTQIKSATGNRGTFSEKSGNILEEEKAEYGTDRYGMKAPNQFGPQSQIRMDEGQTTDKIVSTSDIKDYFARAFDIPIRMGKFRHKALGIYKRKEEVVRLKDANDIAIIAHEVAHHIDKTYKVKNITRGIKGAVSEITKLDYEYPKKTRFSEGFAEFVRMWITGEDVTAVAPKFTAAWNDYLENNKELKDILKQGAYLIDSFQKQGAVERIYSQIDVKGEGITLPLKDKIRRYALLTKAFLFDQGAILEDTEKQIRGVNRLDPRKINPETSPTMIYRDTSKTATAKARSMVLDGTYDFSGKTTGVSLRDVLTPINKNNFKQFMVYIYARRALDLYARDINPGINKTDAEYAVKKFETQEFKDTLQGITDFEDRVLDYLVDAGGLSAKAKETIRTLNPIHIPLKRVFEESFELPGQPSKIADMGSQVKRIKGSSRKVKNFFTSIIENTAAMISMADKARIGRALIELAEKEPGSGKFIEKIAAPMQLTKFTIDNIKKELTKAGVDISDADTSKILSLYTNAKKYFGKDNVVSLWRKGNIEFFEVSPELYRALKSVDKKFLPWYLEWLFGKPTKLIKMGATGLRAGFSLITNPIRDTMTLALQTEYGKPWQTPYLLARAIGSRIKSDTGYNLLFKRSGVDMSQFLGLDKNSLRRAVDEVLASDAKSKALNIAKHPIEIIKEILSVTEALPRLAEYEQAYKEGERLYGKGSSAARIMGSNAAADVTINFRRAGYLSEVLNQLIPFFNVALQGPEKMYRFAKENPAAAIMRGVAGLLLPTLALWWLNKDEEWYKDLPTWQKVMFWNFQTGTQKIKDDDGKEAEVPKIVRLPRPFEWGIVFSAIPEALLNYQYDKNPEALKDSFGRMLDQSAPPIMPSNAGTLIENWTNYDFFRDRPIVPYYSDRYDPPEKQYTNSTSITAKKLGELLGYSPAKIEHFIEGTTGGLGTDIIRAAEGVRGIKQSADIPVVGRLFSRERLPAEKLQSNIYQIEETIQKIKRYTAAGKDANSLSLKVNMLYDKIYPKKSMVIKASVDLLKKTGDTGVLPPLAGNTVNISGYGAIPLTKQEQILYQDELVGRYINELEPQVDSAAWGMMSAKDKIEAMTDAAKKARKEAKEIMENEVNTEPDRLFNAKLKNVEREQFLNEAQ